MKPITLHMNTLVSPARCRLAKLPQVALGLALALVSVQSHADTAAGCVYPVDDPNPSCGYSAGAGKCLKVAYSVTPQECIGRANDYVCWIYYVNGTETWYSHPGSGSSDCGCASNGWVQDGDPRSGQIEQAYNNDTSCGG